MITALITTIITPKIKYSYEKKTVFSSGYTVVSGVKNKLGVEFMFVVKIIEFLIL